MIKFKIEFGAKAIMTTANLPDNILHLIERSGVAVAHHPQHNLNLGYRWALYSAMGPRKGTTDYSGNPSGHERRTHLSIMTAEFVRRFWEEKVEEVFSKPNILRLEEEASGYEWNIDTFTPASMIQTAKDVQAGTIDVTSEILKRAEWGNLFFEMFFSFFPEPEYGNLIEAGFTATHSLRVALDDEFFESNLVNFNLTEYDIDWFDYDVAFYAASAFSDGPVWVPESNARRRLEFWKWWLNDAVPTAYLALQ